MYQLRTIGKISTQDEKTVISVDDAYRKALKYLDEFSHVHVFYTYWDGKSWNLNKKIMPIQQMDGKKGILLSNTEWSQEGVCNLIDLKPYFPSEDSVKNFIQTTETTDKGIPITQTDTMFELEPVGMIRSVNGEVYMQLKEMEEITGTYYKVYWWFHKFDSDKYRQATQCNPPYENAPRTGIFATRSPVRPNPIAMTVVKVKRVDYEQKRIYINEIESFDKTPCLGIQAYESSTDCIQACKVPKWLSHWPRWIEETYIQADAGAVICQDSELMELLRKSGPTPKHDLVSPKSAGVKGINEFEIMVRGARENNLRGIHVKIPYGKITAVVGVSGSGKSSLVNDTIYAECRRRMEYLTHNRNLMQKPRVESMTGCIPAVIISQGAIRGNSLSTVGTYTSAYDYVRVIYAGAATRHCPNCGNEIIPLSRDHILTFLSSQDEVQVYDLAKQRIEEGSIYNLEEQIDDALNRGDGAFYVKISDQDLILLQTKQKCYRCDTLMFEMTPQTFSYVDPDSRCPVCNGTGKMVEIDENKIIDHPELSLLEGASSFYGRLRTFLENPNANWMKGQVFGLADDWKENLEKPWNELSPDYRDAILHGLPGKDVTFSYHNRKNGRKGEITRPVEGICQIINRIYKENADTKALDKYMSQIPCKSCNAERLGRVGRMATIGHIRYPQAAAMTFYEIVEFCYSLKSLFEGEDIKKIENPIMSLKEIAESAIRLGIGYLQMNQETSTLSGGEGQRVKLLGASLNHMTGILYIFDEPSKGLHPNDYDKVMRMLQDLKEEGNTILMVEHNEDMIRMADHIIEIGPGAGDQGGLLVGEGSLDAMMHHKGTQISKYMDTTVIRNMPYIKQNPQKLSYVKMEAINNRNLKDISVAFPKNAFTCICGISGSGKSSLMKGGIYHRAEQGKDFSEVILVDQIPIGKTSKSIIATYIGIMDLIREAFSTTDQALQHAFDERYFSFNGELGQCNACKGEGRIKIKYIEDSYITCPDCNGKRYQKKILEISYQGRNIDEILCMSIQEAMIFWSEEDEMMAKLKSLQRVGLGYLKLGQSTASLSGGEASRLKLAKELVSKKRNNILYLLDEPTTGLHFSDIEHLLELISELIQYGNTVIAIEHNRQFTRSCDWVIELGPGAGKDGGKVIRQDVTEKVLGY